MITDDKVLEIEHYCQEHNVSRISRLKELGIPKGQFYRGKMRLQLSCTSTESCNVKDIPRNSNAHSGINDTRTTKRNNVNIVDLCLI